MNNQSKQIDSTLYWNGHAAGYLQCMSELQVGDRIEDFNFDDLPATAAGMEIDGGAFGMDGVKLTADSNNGWFDTTLIAVIVGVGVLFALTHLVDKWLGIYSKYFKK